MHWSIVRATGRQQNGRTGLTIFAFALMMLAFGLCTASSQPLQFIKNGPAVLGPGGSGAWDAAWTNFVSVIHENSQYVMWYSGATNDNGVNLEIGRATSADGILWQKDAHNPVFAHGPSGAWDAGSAWIPKVIRQGAEYTMWYTGMARSRCPVADRKGGVERWGNLDKGYFGRRIDTREFVAMGLGSCSYGQRVVRRYDLQDVVHRDKGDLRQWDLGHRPRDVDRWNPMDEIRWKPGADSRVVRCLGRAWSRRVLCRL